MIPRHLQTTLWRTIQHTWRSSAALLVVCLLLLVAVRWYRNPWSLEDVRSQLLLTLIALVLCGWLMGILVAGVRRFPKTVVIACIGIILSGIFYLLLVWTPYKPVVLIWRIWWIALISSIAATQIVWLRLMSRDAKAGVIRVSIGATLLLTVLLISLAVRRELLGTTADWFNYSLIALAVVAGISSTTVWWQARRARPRQPLALWQKLAWSACAVIVTFGAGFYVGRITMPAASDLGFGSSPLAHLSLEEIEGQLASDLHRLKAIGGGVDELIDRSRSVYSQIKQRRDAEQRAYFLPEEEDALRARFMSYLAYRAALLRMAAGYSDFQTLPDPQARAKCFLTGYAAAAMAMRMSAGLVSIYGNDDALKRKLNEPDEVLGLRAGEFDRILHSVTGEKHVELFESMAAYFEEHEQRWRGASELRQFDVAWLADRITSNLRDVRAMQINRDRARLEQIIARVKSDAYQRIYGAQSLVSTIIGDTRMVERPPFISHAQIVEMQRQLQPGDILLERRNWFMSNAFLPGFWPHAAMYVGTIEDLQDLRLARKMDDGTWTSDEPAIRDRLDNFLKPAHDGSPHTVIESVSEGVIFNSLTESMHADYVAILRPRLTNQQKAQAIARAFAHEGCPYDFEFDFFSSDKLVCTELVYRSYDGLLRFGLVRVMGRDTLPAVEIARKYRDERGTAKQELDFVMFLDAFPQESRARLASEDDFCRSIDRPRGFNE